MPLMTLDEDKLQLTLYRILKTIFPHELFCFHLIVIHTFFVCICVLCACGPVCVYVYLWMWRSEVNVLTLFCHSTLSF